jgi:oligopeptide/dipeptide ABC transporter ATP-binding protein
MAELLRLEDLRVHFPVRGSATDSFLRRARGYVRAVDGINLTIDRGEILALAGESGSGKTTTGRVIAKLTRQTGGRVVFDGTDVSDLWSGPDLAAYRRRVQVIFQDPYETLDPKQTIHDFVAEPLEVNRIAPSFADREARILGALETAGLRPATEYAFRYPHELSGGQRQRVVIAGALVMGPELVVADEPISMLDVSIRTELIRLLLDLRDQHGLTYLFITHDLAVAWAISDRVAVMYLGQVVELGPTEVVVRDPRHPYTRALLSVVPTPTPRPPAERESREILVGETPDAAHIPSGCRFHPRCPMAEPAGIMARCRTEEPPLFPQGAGHVASCWLVESGRSLGPPPVVVADASPAANPAAVVAGIPGTAAAVPDDT